MQSAAGWMGSLLAAAALGALACAGPEPVVVHGGGVALRATLDPARPRVGSNRLAIELLDAQGGPIERARLRATVHMPAMGAMAAMGGPLEVEELGRGRYRAPFELSMAGSWRVEIELERPELAPLRATGSLTVGSPSLRLEIEGAEPGRGSEAEHAHGTPAGTAPGERAHPARVQIAGERLQRMGIRIATAGPAPLARRVRTLGVVRVDEGALHDVSLRVRGWVVALSVEAEGDRIEAGQVLFTLYSPELYAAQAEYLEALRSRDAARGTSAPERAHARARAARDRLRLAGMAPPEIEALARRAAPMEEVPIRAPRDGFVLEKSIAAGSGVESGARLLRIAPLDRVWIEAEAYADDLALVREGDTVRIEPSHRPDREIEGRIAAILPRLGAETRTARLRIAIANEDLALRPQMYANVWLEAEPSIRLAVPESAVLHAGERDFVFLELGEGRFEPREVELGIRAGELVEVASGLVAGQRVVASGTFLVAAESRLRAALGQW